MKIRRVGSITCGISLVIFGVLFLLSSFTDQLDYSLILRFWPVILIGLGLEMLAAACRNLHSEICTLKYDKGAIFIMITLMFFACGMGLAEFCIKYMETHAAWYY
ncbi:MAG: DUF5668 domain-containing protein [Lachnospiraceae bacterium]|nr:DUF5668 domain-containing protein [Lachnospiraceae bacterium]